MVWFGHLQQDKQNITLKEQDVTKDMCEKQKMSHTVRRLYQSLEHDPHWKSFLSALAVIYEF